MSRWRVGAKCVPREGECSVNPERLPLDTVGRIAYLKRDWTRHGIIEDLTIDFGKFGKWSIEPEEVRLLPVAPRTARRAK